MDMNIVVLLGRLTKDAEVSTTKNGKAVCGFELEAVRKSGDAETVALQYYGQNADEVGPYMTKGRQVAVKGRLKTDSWEYGGKSYSKLVVVVEDIEVLGFKKDDRGEPMEGPHVEKQSLGPEAFNDDDIPF